MFLKLYSINWPNFIARLPLLLEILVNICIAIVCYPSCDVIDFKIDFIFLVKPFSCKTKTSKQKFKYLEKEELLTRNKKYFSSFLKDFQLPKVVSNLRVRL